MKEIYYNLGKSNTFILTHTIIDMIDKAEKWVKACNLYFDDVDIRDAFVRALKRGVAVFVLTNLQGASFGKGKNRITGKMQQSAQTVQNFAHARSLDKLFEEGAHISGLDGLHAKYLLTETSGIVTSANFTPNSISRISEAGVKVTGKEYDVLEGIFDYIFLRPDKYRFARNDSFYSYERPANPINTDELPRDSGIRITLGSTNRETGFALQQATCFDLRDEIFDIINSSDRDDSLFVITYSLNLKATDGEGKTLYRSLLDAMNRGVDLHIVRRKNLQAGEREFEMKLPFKIWNHPDNHAKLVFNSKRGILMTGNLTEESFLHGFDVGVMLSSDQIESAKQFAQILLSEIKEDDGK